VKNTVNSVKSAVSTAWNAMPESVRGAMENVKSTVLNIWDNVRSGVSNRLGGIRDTVASGLSSAIDYIRNIANSSWQWGYDIMQNLINGIRYMIGNLINTVSDVANSIWEYLHFSVPEKGPLTDFESWMPDFMNGLADGINKSKKVVTKAISSVADAMQMSLNSDLDYSISGAMKDSNPTGTIVNNYNNSRTVNQTNNSPKSLSRLEIYRQTRNAVNV
jgi:phage-related protein